MTDKNALDYVTRIVKRSGTSFYWGMRLLPREKRRAMYGVYAFCREVDDIADGALSPVEKIDRLAAWRVEIGRVFSGGPQTPVGRALADPVRKFGLRESVFNDVIDGMETDSAGSVRMADMAALERYCDRVACAVGRLSNPIFGIEGETGERLATSLGLALQFTNILRDFHEDALVDRLYVPLDMLGVHGIESGLPAEIIAHPAFPAIAEHLASLGRRHFAEASNILDGCDPRAARPPNLMLQNYSRVLDALTERGWADLDKRLSLSKSQKLWIIVRYGLM